MIVSRALSFTSTLELRRRKCWTTLSCLLLHAVVSTSPTVDVSSTCINTDCSSHVIIIIISNSSNELQLHWELIKKLSFVYWHVPRGVVKQEAQLPQRNSASAANMDGGGGGLALQATPPLSPLVVPVRMVESESHNVRTSSVPSVKRTLR